METSFLSPSGRQTHGSSVCTDFSLHNVINTQLQLLSLSPSFSFKTFLPYTYFTRTHTHTHTHTLIYIAFFSFSDTPPPPPPRLSLRNLAGPLPLSSAPLFCVIGYRSVCLESARRMGGVMEDEGGREEGRGERGASWSDMLPRSLPRQLGGHRGCYGARG
ncbi:hypothetical protein NL108_009867 [Boleophthalmus pectinirostris]|nr:hypothetical protein NL108_009867 [Boleophthalmus pectinirostris]